MQTRNWWTLLMCAALSAPVAAIDRPDRPAIDHAVMGEGFLSAHPDLRWRKQANLAIEAGHPEAALQYFKRASRYGDKLSQAQVADMYWRGIGTPEDRVLAYVWMDLAGERLYPALIAFREHYWADLDASERRAAIERGQAIFAEYGDDVAKPRLAAVLERHRRAATGGRLGASVQNMRILISPTSMGPLSANRFGDLRGTLVSGDEYYDESYWNLDQYLALHDQAWDAPIGQTRVGDIEFVRGRSDDR